MTEAEFAGLRAVLKRASGLDLGPDKRYLVESRLRPVWQAAGLASLADLIAAVARGGAAALEQSVVEAMATNETSFFRDKPLFDTLRHTILPRLMAARMGTKRLRVWSAAVSTGQEAYSVAMAATEAAPRSAGWTVSILGTDLSDVAVARARDGTYSQFEVQRGLPIRLLLEHFSKDAAGWTVSGELKRMTEFRTFNLLDRPDGLGLFDLILCRNVLIYLDRDTRSALLERLAAALAPGGALCVGASETVVGLSRALVPDREARGFAVLADAPSAATRAAFA